MQVLIYIIPLLITILTYYALKKPAKKLPPGPPKLPLIGNLHQLASKTTLPHRRLADLSRTYGRVMSIQLGELPTVVVSSADMAREVLKTHDAVFCNKPQILIAKEVFYECTDIGFAPYAEYWRNVRKIATLELFTMKRIISFRTIRVDEVTHLIDELTMEVGSVVDLSTKLFGLTCDLISRAGFSMKPNELETIRALSKSLSEACSGFSLADLYPSIKFLYNMSGMKKKFQQITQQANRIFDPIIEEHKSKKKEGTNDHEDLVDVLLTHHTDNVTNPHEFSLSTENIKALMMDLLSAGSDTSSATVEFAMSELLKNPAAMKKATDEVRRVYKEVKGAVDECKLQELKYLKLVIKETLRLHPPAPMLAPRESMAPCSIDPYDLPMKTRVFVNVWAIMRDPEYWPDPEKFDPERFEDSAIDFKGNDFELLPFGSGRRRCPGMALGLANVELPLAMLLYHFDWKLPHGVQPQDLDMDETFGLTVRRKNPLQVIPILFHN